MRIAIVGCGFVADLYLETLHAHPDLQLAGVWDRDPARLFVFARTYDAHIYESLEDLLADPSVELVLNLTNPGSHYEVSRACLRAGKHVYSEKPLAMDLEHARELVALARDRGLALSGAPCRLLGRPAQTMWRALRDGVIGKPYLAYAEMDDGLLHRMAFRSWRGRSGAPWPYRDELEVGNTLEHAGYALTWLAAFFGPAESVTAFAARVVPDKRVDVPLEAQAADFSVACVQFRSGPVARLTCSIVAPHDHAIRVFGEEGTLSTDDCWKPESPVRLTRRVDFRGRSVELPVSTRIPLLGDAEARARSKGRKKVDFCLGPVEVARALADRRPPRLSAELCLHVTEISLAITRALDGDRHVVLRSTFDPIAPAAWAESEREASRCP